MLIKYKECRQDFAGTLFYFSSLILDLPYLPLDLVGKSCYILITYYYGR